MAPASSPGVVFAVGGAAVLSLVAGSMQGRRRVLRRGVKTFDESIIGCVRPGFVLACCFSNVRPLSMNDASEVATVEELV